MANRVIRVPKTLNRFIENQIKSCASEEFMIMFTMTRKFHILRQPITIMFTGTPGKMWLIIRIANLGLISSVVEPGLPSCLRPRTSLFHGITLNLWLFMVDFSLHSSHV